MYLGKAGIGEDERPGGELAEYFCATGAIVRIGDVGEFLADRRGIGVIPRGLRTEDAEIDRDQDGAEAIVPFDLMRFGQADQAADFRTDIGTDMLLRRARR
jgi:hypothetical protein